jgi:hypothetical protein
VKAGATTKVDYGAPGRTVIGRAVTDPPGVSVDWMNDVHWFELKLPPLSVVNREDFTSSESWMKEWLSWQASPARLEHERRSQSYELIFQSDGTFRIDDVQPATYELRLQVTKPTERYRSVVGPEDQMGAQVREVVVPPGDGTFDLGEIVVPVNVEAGASARR